MHTRSGHDVAHPAQPSIRAVVFDLGGVLIDWNPRYLYRGIFRDETAMEHFLTAICSPAWNDAQDRGRSWDRAVSELVSLHPQFAEQIRAYHWRWEETLGAALHETVEVLARLRSQDVRLLALTNWSHEKFPVARARFEFLTWFEGIVVSGEERLAKPDREIFDRMKDRFGLVPSETLFIDDSARNIGASASLGYQTIHFRDAAQLVEALKQYGLA